MLIELWGSCRQVKLAVESFDNVNSHWVTLSNGVIRFGFAKLI